jgi:hypothetical protein
VTTSASHLSRSTRLLFLFVVCPLVLSGCPQLLCDFGISDLCETYGVIYIANGADDGSAPVVVNGTNLLIIMTLNVIYTVLVRRMVNLRPLVLFQLFIDVIHFTLTIYKTGSLLSPFSFLYFFVIFNAAILVSGRATYLVAATGALLYSLTAVAEFVGLLPHQDYFSPFSGLGSNPSFLILTWTFSLLSFFAFAALASYLTTLVRRRQAQLRGANAELDHELRTMSVLYRTSKALSSHTRVREVVDFILGELLEHLQLDRALLYLNMRNEVLDLYMVKLRERSVGRDAVQTLEQSALAAGADLNISIPLEINAGLTARAALERRPYNIRRPDRSPLINRRLAQQIGMNPFALAPMIIRRRVVGVIGIDRNLASGPIDDEEFRILQMFANQTAITIASLQNVALRRTRRRDQPAPPSPPST